MTNDGNRREKSFVNRPRRIFLSYASRDADVAHRIVAALSEGLPSDFQFVLDATAVQPGDNLIVKMTEAISQSDALIVVISEASVSSNWVRSEIAWALAWQDGTFPIFPVLFTSSEAIPHLLRARVYIDFTDINSFNQNILRLRAAILQVLDGKISAQPDTFESTFELERWRQERKHREVLQVRMSAPRIFTYGLSFLGAAVLLIASSAIAFLSRNNVDLREIIFVILAPFTGLAGIIIGFYSGRKSSGDSLYSKQRVASPKREAP